MIHSEKNLNMTTTLLLRADWRTPLNSWV